MEGITITVYPLDKDITEDDKKVLDASVCDIYHDWGEVTVNFNDITVEGIKPLNQHYA